MRQHIRRTAAVAERELRTVTRTRTYGVLSIGFVTVLVGLALTGGVSGYLSTVLNLLTPLELLLPVLTATFGYRALIADRESGELDILRTFPLSRPAYVGGVLIGRLTVLLTVVLGTFVVLGVAVPLITPESSQFLRRQTTFDGLLLFVRFAVVTSLVTVVLLTIVTALSAVARRSNRSLALTGIVVIGLVVGLDLAIVTGSAAGFLPNKMLPWLLAVSPLSAYRTLVLGTVVEPAIETTLRAGSIGASLLSLSLWLLSAVGVAAAFVWTPTDV